MSRSTQYIGLTKRALEWADTALETSTYTMTEGMFGEPIEGKIFHLPVPSGPNTALIAKEVVFDEPWSSGPMIFTCLEVTLIKECGQELECGQYYEWTVDPLLQNEGIEYDRESGSYYV